MLPQQSDEALEGKSDAWEVLPRTSPVQSVGSQSPASPTRKRAPWSPGDAPPPGGLHSPAEQVATLEAYPGSITSAGSKPSRAGRGSSQRALLQERSTSGSTSGSGSGTGSGSGSGSRTSSGPTSGSESDSDSSSEGARTARLSAAVHTLEAKLDAFSTELRAANEALAQKDEQLTVLRRVAAIACSVCAFVVLKGVAHSLVGQGGYLDPPKRSHGAAAHPQASMPTLLVPSQVFHMHGPVRVEQSQSAHALVVETLPAATPAAAE